MTEKIFKSMMKVTILSLFFCFAFIVGILYQHFETELFKQLESEAHYVGMALDKLGNEYLETIDTNQRITLISMDGEVLYDNQIPLSEMDNHSDREEVVEAINLGYGKSERYSTSAKAKILYYAILLKENYILRIADNQNNVFILILRMIQPILIVFLFTVCVAWYIARKLTHLIVEPINAIDLKDKNIRVAYAELDPLARRIRQLTRSLKNEMNMAKKQQKEFKMITDHMSEGFVVIGKDLEILSYNESICRHLDINMEILGQSIYVLNEDEEFVTFIEDTMKNGHNDWIQEVDGTYYQWISNCVETNGKVGGAVIVVIDVSEKIKQDHFRRDFTANISHELKTPLTSISGFAEIMKNGMVLDEDVKYFAEDIYTQSQRLIQLVNDIIRLSQLDDHTLVYQKESVFVDSEIKSILQTLKPAMKKKNIDVMYEGVDIEIQCVASIFYEIIYNLIDNAIKYNKDNGNIVIKTAVEENRLKIVVKDSGIGIPMQDQPHIFERFYRVDKSRSSAIGGTGLGLSIVKHGVSTLQGNISLQSTLNEGSEITVDLPLE